MRNRTALKITLDLLAWSLTLPLAYWLRLDSKIFEYSKSIQLLLAASLPFELFLLLFFKIHRHSWHKISSRDLVPLAKMVAIWAVGLSTVSFFLKPYIEIPRSVPIIAASLALTLLFGLRWIFRVYYEENRIQKSKNDTAQRVLIIGAGEAGTMLVREMLRHPESNRRPIGFLDDDSNKQKQRILGLPVLGTIADLETAVADHSIDEAMIAIPSAPGKVVRRVVDEARKAGIPHRIIPGIYDLLSGKVAISEVREVDVEDLLRREPVQLDLKEIAKYLTQKTVLITGAGGSIGSELVRQVAQFNPKLIILVGRGENSIYQIEREIDRAWPHLAYKSVIADVRDREKLAHVFADYRPQVIFHAAAHKHVPLMECNSDEAILNNVGGTKNLVELSLQHEVERFVNISTDKAINPTSMMGATKRISEYLVEWAGQQAKPSRGFVSVRFGNVLGSRGSVIPLFREQIKRREPITITHPDMTRYFMTIPEAAQLVLQAGGLEENGAVYVLDMGEPVKILDLAHDLIKLSGLTPGTDIEIKFTGMRPGEKLFEELLTHEERARSTRHSKIFASQKSTIAQEKLIPLVDELFKAARNRNVAEIRELVTSLIPSYSRNNGQSIQK